MHDYACMRACVRACMRACVCACVCACADVQVELLQRPVVGLSDILASGSDIGLRSEEASKANVQRLERDRERERERERERGGGGGAGSR